MTLEQRNRIRKLSAEAADLILELRDARATSGNKAKVRGVLKYLEKAAAALDQALGRAASK
jgi:hypothetical protein